MDSLLSYLKIRVNRDSVDASSKDLKESYTKSLPAWSSDLVRLGCWLSESYDKDKRKFVCIWVPTRLFASAFIALGVMVSSARKGLVSMNYQEFLDLPLGSKVRVWDKDNKGRYRALDNTIIRGRGKAVRCLSKGNGKTRFVYPDTFADVELFEHEPISERQQTLRNNMKNFFSFAAGKQECPWAFVSQIESIVITNKTKWNRELESVELFLSTNPKETHIKFTEALQANADCENKATRTFLSSAGDEQPTVPHDVPVILDGANSFLLYDRFPQNDTLIILAESEYDYSMESTIHEMLSSRNDLIDMSHLNLDIKALAFDFFRECEL